MEQRHQHKRCKVYSARCWKFLSRNAIRKVRIHALTSKTFPTTHNQPIQPTRERQKWLGLRRNLQGNLRPSTSWKASQQAAQKNLGPAGYYEVPHTPGLFTNVTCPIQFTLVVDDFGVKYVGKEHADHLIKTLEKPFLVIPIQRDTAV